MDIDKKYRVIYQIFSKVVCSDLLGLIETDRIKILDILKEVKYKVSGTDTEEKNLPYTSDVNLLEMPELHFLKHKILRYVNDYMHNILRLEYNNFKITTSWAAKTKPGQKSHWHNHNNCFYSGVYYVNTYENCGNIKFHDFSTTRNQFKIAEYNKLNSPEFFIEPVNDKIILFPAEVYHQVAKNNSNKDRYSIAFNIIPTGEIGEADSKLIIKD